MNRELEFLDEALEEAEEAALWYAERSAVAAAGFAEELGEAVGHIERAPNSWPIHEHNTRRFLLRRFPYSVVYRVDATRIVIVAVATRIGVQAIGETGWWILANKPLQPSSGADEFRLTRES